MKIYFKLFLAIFLSTATFANTPNITVKKHIDNVKKQEKNIVVSENTSLENVKAIIPTADQYIHQMDFDINKFPKKPPSRYPDININGQYEGKFSGRDYNPKLGSGLLSTDPLWDTIRNDPVYKKLPNDVLVGDPKLEIRYNVQIDGKLDKDLTVHFDVEQEPEFNGKYDVQVTHKKSKLKFHNFDIGFQQGQFINVNRALNGVMYANETPDWEGKIAQGQLRSTQQRIQINGNNKATISLGRTYVLPGSVKIWKNNKLLRKTTDYTVDHYKGTVTFSSAPTNLDSLNIVYEFTNPIADLIPVLNKKNFFGVQYKYRSKEITQRIKQNLNIKEKITVTKDENSENINNVYYLKKTPIILGSDSLLLNNVPLYKNKDYFLKTHTGKIKFVNINLHPSDNIEANYSYYKTKNYEETLIGSNSPGWYELDNAFIIDGSTTIFLGQIEKFEGLDYIIDYDKGRLRFNYPIEYPTVIAVNYDAVETKELSNKNKQRPFQVGFTYLNEYVKTEDEEQFKQVVSENVTISNNIFTVQHNPLTTTSDITIELNNTIQDPSTYTVDLYKGEIRFNNPTIGSAKVSYKYKESFRTKYQFQITRNDNVLEFENNSYPGFYLQDTPVKFNGKNTDGSINYSIKEVRIQKPGQDLLTLTPGISFDVDFDDDGQNIILKFIKKSAANQSILEQENLPAQGDVITMIYEFTPNNASGSGNVDQKQYGLTLGTQLNTRWNFKADIAAASTNLSKPEKDVIGERLQGTGEANANYTLSHKDIKEDSESIIISREGIRLTKGRDYIINYTTGIIKFINLTPSTSDTIFVDYTYYDNGAEVNKNNTMAYASKFSSSYNFDHVKVNGYLTNIGDNYNGFTPLQANKAGSTAFGGNLEWRLKKQDKFSMNYNRNSVFAGTKDNSDKAYTNTDTLNTATTLTFLDNIKTSHSTSYTKVIQDPLTTIEEKNLHATDTESFSYNFSTSFGPRHFKQTVSQGIGESNSDILDQINPKETKTKTFKYSSEMLFKQLFLIGNTSLNTNYSTNLSRAKTFTIGETRITENLKITNTESKGIGTTIKPLRALTGTFSYNKNNSTIKYIGDTAETNSETASFSENYGTNYTPYTWLKTNYTHSRNESASPLLNQKNNRSTKTKYHLQRLGIRGLLDKYFFIDRDSFIGKWINNTTVVYNLNKNIDIKNNDLSQFESEGNSWTLSRFQPIPGISFKSYSNSESKSENVNKVATTTSSENISTSLTKSQSGGLSYTPKLPILNYLNYNLDLTEKSSIRESQTIARSSTGNITLDTEKNSTRGQKLALKPLNLKIGIPYIYTFNLGKLSASAGESFLNKQDERSQQPTPLDPNQTVTKSTLIENQLKTILTYNASFSPLNILTLKGIYTDTDDKTTRDLIGVNYRLVDRYSLSTSYAFFKSFLTLGGTYENQLSQQYGSSQKDTPLKELLNLKNSTNRDTSIFSNSFENNNDKIGLSTTLRFFKILTITGSGAKSSLKQISYSGVSGNTTTRFKQNSASAGTSISPINGMNIGYTYTLNETYPNGGSKQLGYGGLLTATYKPLKTKFVDVNITYTRTDTWGKNYNTFEQNQLIDGTGRTVETEVVETDNTIENAAVNVNVNIPLNNSPYVDRIVIQGEGYVKKVLDRLEHQKDRRYSYDIGGIMIKGTLHF